MRQQVILLVVALSMGGVSCWRRAAVPCTFGASVVRLSSGEVDVFEISTPRDLLEARSSCECAQIVDRRARRIVVRVDFQRIPGWVIPEVILRGENWSSVVALERH